MTLISLDNLSIVLGLIMHLSFGKCWSIELCRFPYVETFYFSFHFKRDRKSTLLVSVQFSRSVVSDSLRPRGTAACEAFLSITISWSLLKFMSIESVMPSIHLILCHPLLLLPSIFPSIKIFSNESVLSIRWPKY